MDTRTIDRALGMSAARGSLLALVTASALVVALIAGGAPLTGTVVGADGAFPVTVVDDEGTEVALAAEPQRIISLSPANTEITYALGAGERLVGRTDWDDYPPEALELTPVATFSGVNMEQVVALEPDLVLAAGNFFTPPDDIATMRELGIPVVVIYAPDVPAVMADIELIGAAVGSSEAASALVTEMETQFDAIAEAVAATEARPRTYYEIGAEPEIYAPAPGSFLADMVVLAGGEPITTADASAWAIPLEQLIVADPEVIVLGDANYGVCPGTVAARPGWDGMTAVADGEVRPVDDVPITRPGPRLAQGLASLARAIHPELELDGFPADPPICPAD